MGMKKLHLQKPLIFLIITILVTSLAACGAPSSPTPTRPAPVVLSPPTTSVPGLASPPSTAIVIPSVQPTTLPGVIATPPVVGSPGAATPKATSAVGQSPTPIALPGTPSLAGLPNQAVPLPSIAATATGPRIRIIYPVQYASFHTTVNNKDVTVVSRRRAVSIWSIRSASRTRRARGISSIIWMSPRRPAPASQHLPLRELISPRPRPLWSGLTSRTARTRSGHSLLITTTPRFRRPRIPRSRHIFHITSVRLM